MAPFKYPQLSFENVHITFEVYILYLIINIIIIIVIIIIIIIIIVHKISFMLLLLCHLQITLEIHSMNDLISGFYINIPKHLVWWGLQLSIPLGTWWWTMDN